MRLKATLAVGLMLGSLVTGVTVWADDHARQAPRQEPAHPAEQAHPATRPEPPPFKAHPPGAHPRGATVKPHAVRVLAPKAVQHGQTPWQHWNHPDFTRPVYYWDWPNVHTVTCTAEDSYGDQYPVSEAAPPGFGLANMTTVEDDALDRCYGESGNDATCVLTSCTNI